MTENAVNTGRYATSWLQRPARLLLATTCLTSALILGGCEKQPPPEIPKYPARALINPASLEDSCVKAITAFNPEVKSGELEKKLGLYTAEMDILRCMNDKVDFLTPDFNTQTGIVQSDAHSNEEDTLDTLRGTLYAYLLDKTADLAPKKAEDILRYEIFLQATATARLFQMAIERKNDTTLATSLQNTYPDAWAIFSKTLSDTKDPAAAVARATEILMYSNAFAEAVVNKGLEKIYRERSEHPPLYTDTRKPFAIDGLIERVSVALELPLQGHITPPSSAAIEKVVPGSKLAAEAIDTANLTELNKITTEITGSKGRLGFLQASREILAQRTRFTAHLIKQDMTHIFKTCTRADDRRDQVPEKAQDLWDNLRSINNSSFLGSAVLQATNMIGSFHCMSETGDSRNGYISAGEQVSHITNNNDRTPQERIGIQIHEGLHLIQDKHGLLNYSLQGTIADFQINQMSLEAAAATIETLLGIESGIPSGKEIARKAAEATYNQEIAHGTKHREALKAAGAAGWQNIFRDREWADYYNNYILDFFTVLIGEGHAKVPETNSALLETARLSGKINDDFNFTESLQRLPDFKERFAGNDPMRFAFERVHLWHLEKTLGADHATTRAEHRRLAISNNPFLNVDMEGAYRTLADKNNKQSVFNILQTRLAVDRKLDMIKGLPTQPII